MMLAVVIGQRTPGHSTADALAFEKRIHQRYVDFIGQAGWDYLGVYDVEGLVPGAFGEILVVDAANIAEAFRRDAENERDMPPDIAAFYSECSQLFWQRGSIKFWVTPPEGWRFPKRGEALRIVFNEPESTGAAPALKWGAESQVATARLEVLGLEEVVAPTGEPLDLEAPRLPEALDSGATVVLHPFVPAPERSGTLA